jgi:hypothetical protein
VKKSGYVWLAAGAAVSAGLVLWRQHELAGSAAALNTKCMQLRALAQTAASSPAQAPAIRAQVEQLQGTKFLSDFEWAQWVAAQATASCSAYVQGIGRLSAWLT